MSWMANRLKHFKDWFFGRLPEGCISVGGQAVMEGVMMQGPNVTAIAVRQPDGKIVYKTRPTMKPGKKYPFLKWPLIRGVVSFVMSLVYGMRTLTESAEMAGEQQEEPSKFEVKVAQIFHMKVENVMIACAVVLAILLSVGLFFALPTGIEALVKRFVTNKVALNLIGGLVRITVFLLYVYLCSKLKEIRRVFQYHGAEHKSIFCFESGKELLPENAKEFSRLHPRCGTSFLVIVMVISIIVFTFLGSDSGNVFARLASRLLLLPLVAGISYEVLKGLAFAENNLLVRALKWPGLMVQKITTADPDEEMLEVALVSLKAALEYEEVLTEAQLARGDYNGNKGLKPAKAPAEEAVAPHDGTTVA
ncbi:MAG: DUF1385 domain-containing protein [Clostridia bacterium]